MARQGICGVGNGRKAMLAEGGGQRGAFPLTHLRVAQACGARARGLGHITPSASVFLCRWDLTLMYKNHTSVVPDSVFFFFFLNSGSGSEIQFLSEAQDDPQKRKPDIKKAKLMLGLEPVVPREEGLNKAIFYFRKELESHANNQYIPKPKPARMKTGQASHN